MGRPHTSLISPLFHAAKMVCFHPHISCTPHPMWYHLDNIWATSVPPITRVDATLGHSRIHSWGTSWTASTRWCARGSTAVLRHIECVRAVGAVLWVAASQGPSSLFPSPCVIAQGRSPTTQRDFWGWRKKRNHSSIFSRFSRMAIFSFAPRYLQAPQHQQSCCLINCLEFSSCSCLSVKFSWYSCGLDGIKWEFKCRRAPVQRCPTTDKNSMKWMRVLFSTCCFLCWFLIPKIFAIVYLWVAKVSLKCPFCAEEHGCFRVLSLCTIELSLYFVFSYNIFVFVVCFAYIHEIFIIPRKIFRLHFYWNTHLFSM